MLPLLLPLLLLFVVAVLLFGVVAIVVAVIAVFVFIGCGQMDPTCQTCLCHLHLIGDGGDIADVVVVVVDDVVVG